MSVSMYQASVPVYLQMLPAMSVVLEKGAAHAAARKIEEPALLNMRLYPDMFPLIRQVRQATTHAAGVGRVAGVELPKFADDETSFAALRQRVATTVDFLKTIQPGQVDGKEDKEIVLQLGQHTRTFRGQVYLLQFARPNCSVHTTCTYAILRHCGVEIGKRDFMGTLPQ